jgi:hypothetical protein
MNNKKDKLKQINDTLKPPDQLGGVFLPKGYEEQFDIMFVAEMPGMIGDRNFDYTARDRFLQEMIVNP